MTSNINKIVQKVKGQGRQAPAALRPNMSKSASTKISVHNA